MKLIKIIDGNDHEHHININFIVDLFDREDYRFVITTSETLRTTESLAGILEKIIVAEN